MAKPTWDAAVVRVVVKFFTLAEYTGVVCPAQFVHKFFA
jgi:hypothetical protein